MSSARKKAYLALLGNAVVWGAALPIVKLALPHTNPFRWLFYRFMFAAPLALPFAIYYLGKFKPTAKQIVQIITLELLGTTAILSVIYLGLERTSAIETSLIASTSPIFVILGGIIFLKEKEEKREWMGLILAFIGTLIVTAGPLLNSANATQSSLIGNGLIVLHNLLWAWAVLGHIGRPLAR